jgi:hypothetical protein
MAANAQSPAVVSEQAEFCPSCGTNVVGKFCHTCGEKQTHQHELALRHFAAHALHELTHLDAKVFSTVRYLFTRPGYLTTEFIAGRRSRYMKPLSLFLVAVALMFLADSIHPLSLYNMKWLMSVDKKGTMNAAWEKVAAKTHQPKELVLEKVQERIHRVVTLVQFVNVFGMAIVLWMLYRRRYFVEHLVMSLHFLAFLYLCTALTWPLDSVMGIGGMRSWVYSLVKVALFMAYLFIALRRVYQQKKAITVIKAAFVYVCVQVAFIVTPIATLVGAVIAAVKS